MIEQFRFDSSCVHQRDLSAYKLKNLELLHTDLILKWRNDPVNAKFFFGTEVLTREGHEAWLAGQIERGRDKNWVIEAVGGNIVGTVSIYNINNDGSAEFGRLLIGEASSRGKGIGLIATLLALDAASEMDIKRVHLTVLSDNAVAIRLYQRVGFVVRKQESDRIWMQLALH